jgi:hypothetical protein
VHSRSSSWATASSRLLKPEESAARRRRFNSL